jgi:hypothetical protein
VEWEYQVGDLVAYTGTSQLYFHFPSEEWYNIQVGDLGIVIYRELDDFGNAYRVKLFKHSENLCWFYDDELSLVSEYKNERQQTR